jgi:hypothetical protein
MTMWLRALSRLAAGAAALSIAATAAAQQTNLVDLTGAQSSVMPGWAFTPSLVLSHTYDDNVLLHGPGDPQNSDNIDIINPRGDLTYNGPHAVFTARYDGAFARYNSLSDLDSYTQRATVYGKRQLSRRLSYFLDASATKAPTTEFLELSGVPFVRTGVFTDAVRTGFEGVLTAHTTISVDARIEHAKFDATEQVDDLLVGGNSIAGDVDLRHRISERTTLTVDMDAQRATLGAAGEVFDIQHATGGVERQLSENVRLFAAGGISRLAASAFGPERTDPSWKLGLVQRYRSTILELSYNRSFVPSFGFGGTTQNEEVLGRVHLPITRTIYTTDLVSYRRNDPLVIDVSHLRALWVELSVGYAARPWMRIEGFFNGTRQDAQVSSALTHNQYGIQVITSTPVRIR